MPTIPLYEDGASPEQEALAAEIRVRRGGDLLNLDRMLLHSPPFAQGWTYFMPKVRADLSISQRESELIICAVARINNADYEFHQHAPLLLKAGASAAQLAALGDVEAACTDAALFSPAERAILRVTLESTRDVRVSEPAIAALREFFPDPRSVVEVVGVIAAYNMVSRVLVALDIPIES